MIAPVRIIIASLFQAFREWSASTPRCFSCLDLFAPSHDLSAWNGLAIPRNFEEVSCEWSYQDFSLRRERVFFSGEQKLSVYCVLSPSDFERSSHPLSIGGNSASQKLLRDRNSGLSNNRDLEKDTLL